MTRHPAQPTAAGHAGTWSRTSYAGVGSSCSRAGLVWSEYKGYLEGYVGYMEAQSRENGYMED